MNWVFDGVFWRDLRFWLFGFVVGCDCFLGIVWVDVVGVFVVGGVCREEYFLVIYGIGDVWLVFLWVDVKFGNYVEFDFVGFVGVDGGSYGINCFGVCVGVVGMFFFEFCWVLVVWRCY